MFERNALFQLILSNMRGYIREPEAIFWTYGFPLLMMIGLGLAFRTTTDAPVHFGVVAGQAAERVEQAVGSDPAYSFEILDQEAALQKLSTNRLLLVIHSEGEGLRYHFDPSNREARQLRERLDDALQRVAGRVDPIAIRDEAIAAPGSRYVDFLVPGLMGMNLMGGGMWGIGFVLVGMRMKKLIKRLLGTPMRRPHFLLSIVGTRVVFFIPEAFFLLLAATLVFGVPIQGSVSDIVVVAFLGAMAFAGLGLLAASRAQRIETISGIMNLVMLPMWLCSGIFFSAERFPDWMQPFIQALPLTQLINALRAVILEGQTLVEQANALLILAVWASVSFLLALRWFRWN